MHPQQPPAVSHLFDQVYFIMYNLTLSLSSGLKNIESSFSYLPLSFWQTFELFYILCLYSCYPRFPTKWWIDEMRVRVIDFDFACLTPYERFDHLSSGKELQEQNLYQNPFII